MPAGWDPTAYLRYADERGRPFADLLARVDVDASTVVDLGCGPGLLTALLRARWPAARIVGVDSSAEMVARARADGTDPGVSYTVGDLREWCPSEPVDVLVSNATLQWVPEHLDLLPRLAGHVAAGGCLAFSVPGNHEAPSHRLLREVSGRAPYAEHVGDVERPDSGDPAAYLDALAGPGWRVDAWETTYLHVLDGPDPVLRWISATGARPVLDALDAAGDGLRDRFVAEYGAALHEAYPARTYGTVLPFRRVFCVAHREPG